MEFLFVTIALLIFMAFVFALEFFRARKKKAEFREKIKTGYLQLNEKKYAPERYVRIRSYYLKHRDDSCIDDITWNDLDMDDVFKRMNYTLSATGEEYLYHKLHALSQDREELDHYEEMIQYLEEHTELRTELQFIFSKLGYTGKFSLYDYIDNLDYLGEMSSKKHVIPNLLFLPLIAFGFVNFPLAVSAIIVLMVYQIVNYYRYKADVDPYITSFAYIIRLLEVCDELEKISYAPAAEEMKRIKQYQKDLNPMRRNSFWLMSGFRGNATEIITMLLDYIRMVFHIDLIKFNSMLRVVRGHIEEIDGLITEVGYLESVVCTWIYRKSLDAYCMPEFVEEDRISMTEAYHPLLTDPVKNSIDANRGVLLTGSNASGKSTFLKTVAINAILAQSIHTCTADSYRSGFFRVFSSMALRDDLGGGDSYYIVEIKALKRILEAAEEDKGTVLCFVDEVLRGTNTVERVAASSQILESLGDNVLCFAATHDIELTSLLESSYDNYHFEEEVADGDVRFNYRLQTGKATTRNAIRLLELMGYPGEIIERAAKRAENFVNTGVWQ